jgi:DNA helicase HerA-like ATPase
MSRNRAKARKQRKVTVAQGPEPTSQAVQRADTQDGSETGSNGTGATVTVASRSDGSKDAAPSADAVISTTNGTSTGTSSDSHDINIDLIAPSLNETSSGPTATSEAISADRGDAPGRRILGFVNFDGRSGDGTASSMLIDDQYLEAFRRGSYVEIESKRDTRRYLGRLVEGPYFAPDYVGLESSIARLAIQKAPIISALPDYHAVGVIEVLGQFTSANEIRGFSTRPFPQSVVFAVDSEGLTELLHLDGELRLGRLDGYDEVTVNFDPNLKKVLPRNVGIFGTVGSGKTNTSQVLIEEAARLGWAVVVLDVEGEYVEMASANNEPAMISRLKELGLKPEGISDFHVYHPVNCDGDEVIESTPFSITFGKLDPYMVAELVGMNDAQEDRFLQVYDACLKSANVPIKPKVAKQSRKKAQDIIQPEVENVGEDTAEAGSDSERLNRFGSSLDDLLDDEGVDRNVTLQMLIDRINKWLDDGEDDSCRKISIPTSWMKVKSQLQRLMRLKLFDGKGDPLNASTLLQEKRVSVINLSDSLEPRVNNLVIADVLGRIFKHKLQHQEPHVLIVIEEAHTFVSKENVRRMEATMEKLREIARRGRKRWISLAFISQQPSHLPQELYELCNNLFVHETKGQKNLDALKGSAGAINEGIWHDVPTLGQGRAILVSPQFKHPVITRMNPSRCKRRMTD